MTLATPNQTRPNRLTEARHPLLPLGASKANELPFLRGDSAMSLFINLCQHATYVNPSLRKRPSREKAYFQTNLTLGSIGKMGNLRLTPLPSLDSITLPPWSRSLPRSLPIAFRLPPSATPPPQTEIGSVHSVTVGRSPLTRRRDKRQPNARRFHCGCNTLILSLSKLAEQARFLGSSPRNLRGSSAGPENSPVFRRRHPPPVQTNAFWDYDPVWEQPG